jgi:hypothetical protein
MRLSNLTNCPLVVYPIIINHNRLFHSYMHALVHMNTLDLFIEIMILKRVNPFNPLKLSPQ